ALAEFLPLSSDNWIVCGNALRLDWLSVCPPDPAADGEAAETYVCGNPPYKGSKWQTDEQKDDLRTIFDGRTKTWKSLDYVAGWFMKAADHGAETGAVTAFVATNSICQGRQVATLWSLIRATG